MRGVPLGPSKAVKVGLRPCTEDPAKLAELGFDTVEDINPFNGSPIRYVREADAHKAEQAGLYLWSVPGYALLDLAGYVERNLSHFVNHDNVAARLRESADDAACKRILETPDMLAAIVQVMRALAGEMVSLNALPVIVACLVEHWRSPPSLTTILEQVRLHGDMRPTLRGNESNCGLIQLAPSFESRLRSELYSDREEPYLALEPEPTQHALTRLRDSLINFRGAGALVTEDLTTRHLVRRLVELEFPYLMVIAKPELLPKWEERVAATLEWS